MNRSTDRILTTHTGSLPRPADLIEIIRAREQGEAIDFDAYNKRVREAVAETVQKQIDAGVDIVSDGEEGKPSYATYVKNRVTGFDGTRTVTQNRAQGEGRDYPEYTERRMATTATILRRPTCTGPIAWTDFAAVERDIDNMKAAAADKKPNAVFMTAASPGVVSFFLPNDYFKTDDEYLEALANVLKDEYEAIANAGFELALDCPDLAMSRQSQFVDKTLEEFRSIIDRHMAVLNEATKNIPSESMRLHLCWGNYEGPHHLDVAMKDIVDIVLKTRAYSISFEGANPRHAHEWNVWQDVKLPDGKVLVPGVIDSTTNFIEHPELVAQRIRHYTDLVGKENVIAGVDCGFGTNAASTNVDSRIVWAKLAALKEGAEMVSKQLVGRLLLSAALASLMLLAIAGFGRQVRAGETEAVLRCAVDQVAPIVGSQVTVNCSLIDNMSTPLVDKSVTFFINFENKVDANWENGRKTLIKATDSQGRITAKLDAGQRVGTFGILVNYPGFFSFYSAEQVVAGPTQSLPPPPVTYDDVWADSGN